MDQLVKGNPQHARLPRAQRRGGLVKEVPFSAVACAHALAAWSTVRPNQPSMFRDGVTRRPDHLVGGRPRRYVTQCELRPGHDGDHKTGDGRTWS